MAMVDIWTFRGGLNFYPDTKDLKRAADFTKKSVKQKDAMFKAITDVSKLFRRANAFMCEGFYVKDQVKTKAEALGVNERYLNRWLDDADKIEAEILVKKLELILLEF
jgi:hypothetical protein